jgi:hypothetical protein
LKWTSNGLGVFARHDMKIVRQEVGEGYGHDTGLHANYQGLVEGINWSIGMVTINKSTVGRPKNIETGRRKSSDRIRNNTLGLISKSLVGPFNFINHACDECAQLEWEENAVKNSIHVTAKKGKRIKKDDEVFINYKGVKCEEGAEMYFPVECVLNLLLHHLLHLLPNLLPPYQHHLLHLPPHHLLMTRRLMMILQNKIK